MHLKETVSLLALIILLFLLCLLDLCDRNELPKNNCLLNQNDPAVSDPAVKSEIHTILQ